MTNIWLKHAWVLDASGSFLHSEKLSWKRVEVTCDSLKYANQRQAQQTRKTKVAGLVGRISHFCGSWKTPKPNIGRNGMAMYGLTWHVQLSVISVEVKKKTVQHFFNYNQSWQNLKHIAILALSPLSGGYLSTVAPRSTEPPSPVRETQSDAAKMFPSLSRILRPSIFTST